MSDALLTRIAEGVEALLAHAKSGKAAPAAAAKAADSKPATATAAAKPATAAKAAPAAAKPAAAATAAKGPSGNSKGKGGVHTLDEVREKIRQVSAHPDHGKQSALDVLASDGGGAPNVSALKPEDYDKVYEACLSLLGESGGAAEGDDPLA